MEPSEAAIIHRKVPPDWYQRGIKENVFQRYWHFRRFTEIGKLIEPSGGKILDIGSADGTFTKVILEHSKADLVVGIDILPSSVKYAKKRFSKNQKLKFRVADAEKLPFKNQEFDAVFCFDSIEHFFRPQKVMREAKRVLKEDGYLVILVHTKSLLFRIIWFFWENTRGRIWKGTHIQNFSGKKLKKIIKETGFKISTEKKFMLGMYRAIKVKKK
jgi:ubiquinone/menaquinone biosynthesis C-methylase UbiE